LLDTVRRAEEVGKLKKRTVAVNREKTGRMKETLEEAMGDIL
jgi:hypothetical protein